MERPRPGRLALEISIRLVLVLAGSQVSVDSLHIRGNLIPKRFVAKRNHSLTLPPAAVNRWSIKVAEAWSCYGGTPNKIEPPLGCGALNGQQAAIPNGPHSLVVFPATTGLRVPHPFPAH